MKIFAIMVCVLFYLNFVLTLPLDEKNENTILFRKRLIPSNGNNENTLIDAKIDSKTPANGADMETAEYSYYWGGRPWGWGGWGGVGGWSGWGRHGGWGGYFWI